MLSTTRNYDEVTGNLGGRYEISLNTYKPFACGIVIHPAIDACIQLRNKHKLAPTDIERIDLGVHPLVLELTGKKTPQTGLETKFSVYFASALALVRGSAGMRDFSDENATDPVIVALRDRVVATIDREVKEEQVRARITLKDGRVLSQFVEHAVGSLERPMSDAALESKALDLMKGVLPDAQARALLDLCWKVEGLPGAAALAAAAVPPA